MDVINEEERSDLSDTIYTAICDQIRFMNHQPICMDRSGNDTGAVGTEDFPKVPADNLFQLVAV